MSIWVTAANHICDFKIRLRFNDGKEGIIDLQRTIFTDSRPIFALLRDPCCVQFNQTHNHQQVLIAENEN